MHTHPSDPTGDLLMAAARRVRREFAAALHEWDITPSQSRALRVIASNEPMRPSALAASLRITPRSTTEVADALEERGWAVRAPDPTDRRATTLALTDSGRRLLEHIDVARAQAGDRVLADLSEGDRRTLRRILTTLREQP